jgi:hypothetical protein
MPARSPASTWQSAWPELRSASAALSAGLFVQDGFDAVAVGVANERGVVARVIVFANAGRPVISATSAQRRCVEPTDGLAEDARHALNPCV